MSNQIHLGDCLDWMREQPDDSIDLTIGSPPYEDARTYGIDFKLRGQDWVDWMVKRIAEMVRITNGLVVMVVEGKTRQFRWSATPALLMADLHRAGVHLRKPPAFHRVGIPGSGGPDWLRNDYEFIVCCTSGGKLPWSDNTAMGKPTKYDEGGACSNRKRNGVRVSADARKQKGTHRAERDAGRAYAKPKSGIANPGNVLKCTVGRGHMGSLLAHENEAPFPESLVEFFVRSFCRPGGLIYDPFMGSGTSAAVAIKHGREFVGTEVRESQVELTKKRISESQTRGDVR